MKLKIEIIVVSDSDSDCWVVTILLEARVTNTCSHKLYIVSYQGYITFFAHVGKMINLLCSRKHIIDTYTEGGEQSI